MRAFLKSNGRWLRAGVFWPLVLLALPDCTNDYSDFGVRPYVPTFDPGMGDRSTAVLCDIPQVSEPTIACAQPGDLSAMSKAHAAVALALSESTPANSLVLNYSLEAEKVCGAGVPQIIKMFGPFPEGYPVCLNCQTQMVPAKYPDGNAVCKARCIDLVHIAGIVPPGGIDNYCAANAHVSTNFDKNNCFPMVCDSGGTPGSFVDPRRAAEDVTWAVGPNDGTSASGNDLTRTAGTTGGGDQDFNAGSAAAQVITKGDGWVELEVGASPNETQLSHVLGVATCVSPCKDGDPQDNDTSLADISWAISLNYNGNVYVLENPGLIVHGPYPAYAVGERFRVNFEDNHEGKATISFSRSCMANTICPPFFTPGSTVEYPLRVDTSFREQFATLKDVTLVRIKE